MNARESELKEKRKRMEELGKHWIECALHENTDCDPVSVSETIALYRISEIFLCLPAYWMLYDQAGAAWIIQAKHLNRYGIFEPEQIGVLNPILVLLFIPLFDKCVFPFLENTLKYELTSVKKMVAGMCLCIVAFILSTLMQSMIESAEAAGESNKISIVLQLPQIMILTLSEILVSTTGLICISKFTKFNEKHNYGIVFTYHGSWRLFGGIFYSVLGQVLSGTSMYVVFSVLMLINTLLFMKISKRFVPYEK